MAIYESTRSLVYTDTLISTIVDMITPFDVSRVYTDTLISTIVDSVKYFFEFLVYTDTLISTIVDLLVKDMRHQRLYRHFNFYYCRYRNNSTN